jgi:hypothetical protein
LLNHRFNLRWLVNKKNSMAKSIAIYKGRIEEVNKKLKEQNLSNLQRNMYESEKKIANEDLRKLEMETK